MIIENKTFKSEAYIEQKFNQSPIVYTYDTTDMLFEAFHK